MSNILFVKSSPRGDDSLSTKVGRALIEQLRRADPKASVTVRDLGAEPPPHIGGDFLAGLGGEPKSLPAQPRAARDRSDALVAELFAADTIVISSAMINFAPSSVLKSWLDHVLRAGVTFRYTANGPEGLVKNKKAYIVAATGGVYSQGPAQAVDFQTPYLRHVLAFMGITDVEVIRIEGVAMGPEVADQAVGAALSKVATLAPQQAA